MAYNGAQVSIDGAVINPGGGLLESGVGRLGCLGGCIRGFAVNRGPGGASQAPGSCFMADEYDTIEPATAIQSDGGGFMANSAATESCNGGHRVILCARAG
jgi:hypothetical protein